MRAKTSKKSKDSEKVIHIRIENNYYKKLEKEAKKNKRSLPNMAKSILENRYNSDFNDKELHKIQSIRGIYSDVENDDDIYTECDIKPIKWD